MQPWLEQGVEKLEGVRKVTRHFGKDSGFFILRIILRIILSRGVA